MDEREAPLKEGLENNLEKSSEGTLANASYGSLENGQAKSTEPEPYRPIKKIINRPDINRLSAPERRLYRPKINYFLAVVYVICHILVSCIIAIGWVWIESGSFRVALDFFGDKLWIIPITFLITLRFTLIWFVKLYQRYAKSETRLRCTMEPSCSEYCIMALKKYGAIIGCIKAYNRLHRCHPPGEIDYP
ncbi:MAG: membrane protein insertion efficiency factor YidD [Clostridia bacterium]|nr:membrane protein insertion efficiency factor YidD [Clostridia bacterium]